MADEEEQDCCPLCMEELDITDKTFDACPCGYQVCLWCWHQIKNEYNGLCPACRTPYSEISKQKNTLDREDVVRRTKQRKQKEKSDRRSAAAAAAAQSSSSSSSSSSRQSVNRKSLANVRVMQRNLVYVIGLPQSFTDEEHLRSGACFGQYGKIVKAVVNKAHLSTDRSNATASAYITFANKEDALACIIAIDGFYLDGSMLRASFGTTKYCNFFLRNLVCNNPDCLYLHELGDQDDSFTKEEMQSALHSGKAAFRESTMAGGSSSSEERAGNQFPAPYRPQAAASADHADAQRKAQSAAAIHKLKQSAHRSDSNSSSNSPPRSRGTPGSSSGSASTITEPFSKIVAGAARAPTPELTMAEKLSERNSSNSTTRSADASPLPLPRPPTPPVAAKSDDTPRRPKLHVDTSAGRSERASASASASASTSAAAAAATSTAAASTAAATVPAAPVAPAAEASAEEPVIVGPLEALKLATGSTIEEPAWAQPFPNPSVVLQSEPDDATGGFSPFTLGFDGGIHRSNGAVHERDHAWGVASAFKESHENDPLGTHNSDVFAPMAAVETASGSAAPSSSLSFASIDAIFSRRTESSEALAGLLGVQLSAPAPAPPLVSSGSTPQAKNARSSRFAFANQPAGLDIPSSPGAPPPRATDGAIPSSPFGMMEPPSRRAPPSPFGYGAAVGNGLGASSASSAPSFPMHHDTSAFPPLGAPHHAPFGSGFGSAAPPSQHQSGDDMMGSGLAFLQQMLPNVNISFGGDYPSHSSGGGSGFADLRASSNGASAPPSAWSGAGLSSLGFDSSSRSSSGGCVDETSASAPSFYDPAIVTHSNALPSDGGFFGLGGGAGSSLESESERHHLHGALGGSVYRHSGSILNNGN